MATEPTWTCRSCGALVAGSVQTCHDCGHAQEAADRKRGGAVKAALRWLVMLPAAFLVSGFGMMLYELMRPFVEAYGGIMFFTDLIACGGMGYLFVMIGAKIAPTKHIAIPIVLAILYIAVQVLVLATSATNSSYVLEPRWGGPHWMIYVQIGSGMIGAVLGVFYRDES